MSASTSIPDLSSPSTCPSDISQNLKSRFSSASSHSLYWSQSSTLSTITLPLTRAREKPSRRQQTPEKEDQRHVICIKIRQEPETELDCANFQDVRERSPVPGSPSPPHHPGSLTWSPSPPPHPGSLTWSSLRSDTNDEDLPPPPNEFDEEISQAEVSAPIQIHSSWLSHIQFARPAQVRDDADLGTASSCYEEEYEAFNEIAEYNCTSLNRKLAFASKGNKENHHLLMQLDQLRSRQRNAIFSCEVSSSIIHNVALSEGLRC